ncbi:hypothetical protein F4604DRAFT_1935445 [Suillus subluteus]|nr:hypothetical protein F4604DRAFT_1935445 [Suillus subluteus]
MVVPCMGEKHQVTLEVHECGNIYRFLVLVSAKVDALHRFPFVVGDRICLSLKGAQSRIRAQSFSSGYLPIALTYNNGFAAKLTSGPDAGKVFNTWEGGWLDATIDDGVQQDSTEYEKMQNTNPLSKNPQPENIARQMAREELAPVLVPLPHCNASAANISQSSTQSPERGLTKAQKRRMQRQTAKGKPLVQAALESCPESSEHEMVSPRVEVVTSPALSSSVIRSPLRVLSSDSTGSSSKQTRSSSSNWPAQIADVVTLPTLANDSARNYGPLSMKAGVTTHRGDQYIPIRNIEQGLGFFNVIGVVTSTKPPTPTRTQEWTRVFSIVDPSCMEDDVDFLGYKLTVNCFQKKHIEWLPQAEVGDIVIFRRLKATAFNNALNGTGYWDKLRWVTYDTQNRRFRKPNGKDAPRSETVDRGLDYLYSPYYEEPNMRDNEAKYCAQLADWWQAICEKSQGITACVPRPSRKHHLISEVVPDAFPQGYFDCTVEILHSCDNSSGPCTVYVTDYTLNAHTNSPRANWCSPELAPYVFKIEMWDDARGLAKMMQPGQYWYLPNARAVMDSSLHLYGKLVETHKSKQLDEVEDSEHLHFCALLERKKKLSQGEGRPFAWFDNWLIEDVDEEVGLFNCTVEVLYVDLASAEEPLVYVTDYTFNPDLVELAQRALWALGLDHRIVKIALEGKQRGRAHDLQPGVIYRIKKLRLIRRPGVIGAFGCLEGDEQLVIAADDCAKDEVKALLQRKETWKLEMKQVVPSVESPGDFSATSHLPTPETSETLTLKQVVASTACPDLFTFIARVLDFYPLNLDQATFLGCNKCKTVVS